MVPHIKYLESIFKSAFEKEGLDPSYGSVRISDRPDLCDYQCNGALSAAKSLKKNPRDLASNIFDTVSSVLENADISIAGPGFINIKIRDGIILNDLNEYAKKGIAHFAQKEKRQKVIIDYGGPNVAKAMHVGHLRSSIIGETIKRLCKYVGDDVKGDIHMGDWGTQMGMLIIALKERFPDWDYFKEGFEGPFSEVSPVTLDDLQEIYPEISARCKEDPKLGEAARLATHKLQQGHEGYRALWAHFVSVSVEDMQTQFERLGVSFDLWFGESRYQDRIPSLLDSFCEKGIAVEDEGALIIPVAREEDQNNVPPLLLRKRDGGYLYGTTDIATIDERVKDLGAEKIIYVVDGRQGLHFEQVFRGAEKAGYDCIYDFIGFGTMNGPDNKPFKTRAGGVMRLEELMDTLIEEGMLRLEEADLIEKYDLKEAQEIAEKVGIAALKFADLQHAPKQNYQFDIKKFSRFEGKTGPYLLYAAVRVRAILEKAEEKGLKRLDEVETRALEPTERDLCLALTRLPSIMWKAYETLSPHILCEYAFDLAQQFSRFYQAIPILPETNKSLQASRLFICEITLQIFLDLFNILGLSCPRKM